MALERPNAYYAQTVARTMQVLEVLGKYPEGLSLADLSRELGAPKSSLFPIVHTLEAEGYVSRTGRGPYRLGLRTFEVGYAYLEHNDLFRSFNAVARHLVEETGETVQMAVLEGTEIVYVAKHEGVRPVRLVSAVGKRVPAHCTALGKALLATLPDGEVERRYGSDPLPAMTPRSITTRRGLLIDLAGVRRRGYAIDREESMEGIACVAAAVRDPRGQVAAVSISVPLFRLGEGGPASLAPLVTRAAAEMSRQVGWRPGRGPAPAPIP